MRNSTTKTTDAKRQPQKTSMKDLPATPGRDEAIKGGLVKKSDETKKNYDIKANKEL